MALSSDPSVTYSSAGNVLANNTTIGAGNNSSGNIVDFSTNSLGGFIAVLCKGGATVNTTNGCQVSVFPASDANGRYDTISIPAFTLTAVASTNAGQSLLVPTGKYSVTLTNLDPANAITAGITSNPIA
jgi:hypothetical protein